MRVLLFLPFKQDDPTMLIAEGILYFCFDITYNEH